MDWDAHERVNIAVRIIQISTPYPEPIDAKGRHGRGRRGRVLDHDLRLTGTDVNAEDGAKGRVGGENVAGRKSGETVGQRGGGEMRYFLDFGFAVRPRW